MTINWGLGFEPAFQHTPRHGRAASMELFRNPSDIILLLSLTKHNHSPGPISANHGQHGRMSSLPNTETTNIAWPARRRFSAAGAAIGRRYRAGLSRRRRHSSVAVERSVSEFR